MDWGELLEQVKDNPDLKQIVSKMAGSADQDVDSMAQQATRPSDVEQAYKYIPPSANKSAADSAQVFQQTPEAPNFTLGDSSSTTPPNFRTQGQPYSGNVPQTVPKVSGVPAVSDMAMQARDVTPSEPGQVPAALAENPSEASTTSKINPLEDQSKWGSQESGSTETPEVAEEDTAKEKKPLSTAQKIALGAGGVGGGAAVLKMLQSDNDDSDKTTPPSDEDIKQRQTAAIASLSEPEHKSNQASSEDEDTEDDSDEQNLNHNPTKQTVSSGDNSDKLSDVKAAMQKLLNFGTADENKNKLDEALEKQRQLTKWAQLSRAGAMIGAGFARVKPNLEPFNEQIKEAALPVQQQQLRQQNQINDPNSGISKGMRDYLQQNLGIQVSNGATAAQMGSVLPMVYKDVEAKQAQAAHAQDLQNRLQAQEIMKQSQIQAAQINKQAQMSNAQAIRDTAQQNKQDQLKQSYDFKTGDAIQRFRGNPGLQNDLRAVQAADQALNTINNPQWKGNYNNIPGPVNEMLNTDLATIYSRGAASDNVIKELSNPTFMKNYENFMAKVGNHPTPAQQGAFIEQNKNLFQDLRDGSQNRINEHYRQILNTQGRMGTPEARENYRQEFLPNDTYDRSGRLVPQSSLPHQGKYPPGSIVNIKGKNYTVAPNGNDLIEQ